MKKLNIKNLALSIVALILVLMLTVGITYSWIDDVKLVEFNTDDLADKTPLKAGVDINSDITIRNTNNVIDFGNMLQKTDYLFTKHNSETDNDEDVVRYEHSSGGTTANTPQWNNDIKNKKGYFYESGGMHFSGCFGDGEHFYFPKNGGSSAYRDGNKDDENVNYISFTTKVSSPDANTVFWFDSTDYPQITDQSGNAISSARFALTVDGKTHVYSGNGKANTIDNNSTSQYDCRKISAYTYNNEDNKDADDKLNGNTLFSIKKGGTVTLNIKIWLEGSNASVSKSDIKLKIISSWLGNRNITIVDKSTSTDDSSWVQHNNAKMFLVLTSLIKKEEARPGYWNAEALSAYFFPFTFIEVNGVKQATVSIPLVYNTEEVFIYRCTKNGWNSNSDEAKQRSDYNVYCWNWWKTRLPDTFCDETYTIYGSSMDDTVNGVFGTEITNKGCGTWGGVEQITFDGKTYSRHSGDNLASYNSGSGRLFVRDYSDYNTSGDVYTYVMCHNGDVWYTYIPKSSTALQFVYKNGDNAPVYWGYHSWSNNNPQIRPKINGSYPTTYYATREYSNQGVGYWNGANVIYVIANGTMENHTPYANMYVHGEDGNSFTAMTEDSSQEYQGYKVYKKESTGDFSTNTQRPDYWAHVKFKIDSDGTESAEQGMFLGCYYDWDAGIWRGSLSEGERGGGDDDDSSGSGTSADIDTGTPDRDGIYLIGDLDGDHSSNNQYLQFNGDAVGSTATLTLAAGKTAKVKIFTKNGSTEKRYKADSCNQIFSSNSNYSYYFKTYESGFGSFKNNTASTGQLVFTFSRGDSNDGAVQISYAFSNT